MRDTRSHWLGALPVVTLVAFLAPIAAGLAGTLLPAFGYLPALGGIQPSLDPWRALVEAPGFGSALRLTLQTGLLATVLSVFFAFGFCAWAASRPWGTRTIARLAPILAAPHSAFAIGLAFVIAPSGWPVRWLSPWLTGFEVPPDVATVNDPLGLALVLGLLMKEIPFLILMIAGAMSQVRWVEQLAMARSLGYEAPDAWIRVVLPQVYAQVRMPVYAVLAFSLSVVDVALILGPSNPPTLAVLCIRWFSDPDLRHFFPAAAAAILLLGIVAAAIALWRIAEHAATAWWRRWIEQGRRSRATVTGARIAAAGTELLLAMTLVALAGLVLWSFAAQWRFPDAWPSDFDAAAWWQRLARLAQPAWTTLLVAMLSTLIALALVVGCLEFERRRGTRAGRVAFGLIYVPLLLPQIAFLFGLQVLLVRTGQDGTLGAIVWTHLVFVLPYLFLSLGDPYRAFDERYMRVAASLAVPPWSRFVRVKLPMLARPIAVACAVGIAISVGQYLATVFAGNGRVATLTTEAVTLAAGADRRVIATYALAQTALPLLAFGLAWLVPAWLLRRRRGLAA